MDNNVQRPALSCTHGRWIGRSCREFLVEDGFRSIKKRLKTGENETEKLFINSLFSSTILR